MKGLVPPFQLPPVNLSTSTQFSEDAKTILGTDPNNKKQENSITIEDAFLSTIRGTKNTFPT
jgi:hypothetical protein